LILKRLAWKGNDFVEDKDSYKLNDKTKKLEPIEPFNINSINFNSQEKDPN
jgi:hypothetical protein